ncbi:MOSC domain-containing protein [Allosphingosinicella deserti]|uniref:MOSC domain-containing protein n=1 Tax=Allosphingosinicella deserti TaxID=2116704 RepID=A0A2P7QJJ7_9SPHN|nr:MOSC domain-containing protein [Sphingomonas deserti]PSJ38147.1 MOSC domain-containing protein [Sphingomonas deserti]
MPHIQALLTGPVRPLGPRGIPSGIDKHPVEGRLWLGLNGFASDAQGDLKHHGGPEKSVHHYPFDHHAAWRGEIGDLALLNRPGAFGENVSTTGLTEADVAIGDVFRAGGALIQVSQGRQPCWKLNDRFGVADMSRRVQATGRTGWYYRVIEEGHVDVGDAMTLVDRPSPDWTIARLSRLLYVDMLDRDALAIVTALPHLAENWKVLAARRLATGEVEDWSRRLDFTP